MNKSEWQSVCYPAGTAKKSGRDPDSRAFWRTVATARQGGGRPYLVRGDRVGFVYVGTFAGVIEACAKGSYSLAQAFGHNMSEGGKITDPVALQQALEANVAYAVSSQETPFFEIDWDKYRLPVENGDPHRWLRVSGVDRVVRIVRTLTYTTASGRAWVDINIARPPTVRDGRYEPPLYKGQTSARLGGTLEASLLAAGWEMEDVQMCAPDERTHWYVSQDGSVRRAAETVCYALASVAGLDIDTDQVNTFNDLVASLAKLARAEHPRTGRHALTVRESGDGLVYDVERGPRIVAFQTETTGVWDKTITVWVTAVQTDGERIAVGPAYGLNSARSGDLPSWAWA